MDAATLPGPIGVIAMRPRLPVGAIKSETNESRVVKHLKSRNPNLRIGALKTVCRFGGPGAVPLVAEILRNSRSDISVREKLLAIVAIGRIANRKCGIYHEGIVALDSAKLSNSQDERVRKAAIHVRGSIPGMKLITEIPGKKKDTRVLVVD
mgnify:CR=1 FL=1